MFARTRRLLSLIFILVVASCAAPSDGDSGAGAPATRNTQADYDAVVAAHKSLVNAYEAADVAAYTALLDPEVELLLFHPRLSDRFVGVDETREKLSQMFSRISPAHWLDVHPSVVVEGDVAWYTSHVLVESTNLPTPFVGRGTEVWIRRDSRWRLAHGHWSPNPEAAPNR